MRIGTLFSGIGAPEQGAKRVYDDLEMVFACEFDKFARESFKANYEIADEHFHVDVNDMDGTQYKDKVDIIIGGSPCQAFSIAGLREGLNDKRGQLIWQYYRIIMEAQPEIFIYENVKGMVSQKNIDFPEVNYKEIECQEDTSKKLSILSRKMLGRFLLERCAEYSDLKNIKLDISHIRSLASISDRWEKILLIGLIKNLQSCVMNLSQIMKKSNYCQKEQTVQSECNGEDLGLNQSLLNSIDDLNRMAMSWLDMMVDTSKSIDSSWRNNLENLLKKVEMLSIILMGSKTTIDLRTCSYAQSLNIIAYTIKLWKSSPNLWKEVLLSSIEQIENIKYSEVLKDFLAVFRESGYYCHHAVLNTKDYGVPQNRERVYIVGFKDHELYHRFEYAPKIKLEKRLKDVLEDEVDEKYYLSDDMVKGFVSKGNNEGYINQDTQASSVFSIEKESPALCAGTHGYAQWYIFDENRINRTLRCGGGSSMSDKHCFDLIGETIKVEGMLNCKGTDQIRRVYGVDGVDGVAATLTTMQGGNQEPKIKVKSATSKGYEEATQGDSINLTHPDIKTRRGRVGKGVAQTLDCACNQAVIEPSLRDVVNEILESASTRIRKLTPRECLRLQDFPDSFKQVVSNSQLYKQAGNSMSVNILEMIFRQIEKAKAAEPTNTLMDFL